MCQQYDLGITIRELRDAAKAAIIKLNLSKNVMDDFEQGILHCTECYGDLLKNGSVSECIACNSNERLATEDEMRLLEELNFISFDEQINHSESTSSKSGCRGIPYYIIKSIPDNLLYVLNIISYKSPEIFDSIEDNSLRVFFPEVISLKDKSLLGSTQKIIVYPTNGKLVYIA